MRGIVPLFFSSAIWEGKIMRILIVIFLILIASIYFTLVLQPTPTPLDLYKKIEKGFAPDMLFPSFDSDKPPKTVEITLYPNWYITNLPTHPIRSWFNVAFDASTPTNIFNDLPPMANVILHFDNEVGALHLEIFIRRSYNAFLEWPQTTLIFIPESPYISLDSSFPYFSYLALDFGTQRFIIGRTKISWGYWDYPVAISPTSPYFNHITYEFLSSNWFSYTFHLISINPILTPEEYEKQKTHVPVNADNMDPYSDRVKTLAAHRLEFKISDNLRWAIGELGLFGGKIPDVYSLNPVAIWHNLYNAAFINVIGNLQVSWTPIKGLNLFLDFALDDFAIPFTEKEDVKPSAYALSLGIIKTVKILDLDTLLEFSYSLTTKWVYNMFVPYLKFDNRQLILSNFPTGARVIYSYPIGFKYGPDAQLFSLKLSLMREKLIGEIEPFYLLKGPATILVDYKSELPSSLETFFGIRGYFESPWGFGFNVLVLNTIWHVGGFYKLEF